MNEEKKIEEKTRLEDISKRVFKHPLADSLEIKRVPIQALEIFKKVANEEFAGDYGMLLKNMVDNYLVEDIRFNEIYDVLESHGLKLQELDEKINKEPTPVIKEQRMKRMLSGRLVPIPDKI